MPKTNRSTNGRVIRKAVIVGLAIVGAVYAPVPGRTEGFPSVQVDEIFAQWDYSDSPGCAIAVIKGGGIIYKRGYGTADLDHNIPITPTTVFHAASLAKQFTAMSVMLLVGQGRLSLDDDVRTHISELPDFGQRITIEDILRHISGIRDQWDLVTLAGWRMSDDVVTRGDVLGFVKRMEKLNFSPRDQFLYSNTGYTLAGLIVERVSGRTLADFARENIFRRLGMAHTTFTDNHGQIVNNRAYGYRGTKPPFDVPPFVLRMPNYDITGPTNLLTTVEDLARWNRNFDDKTVGGDAALSKMQTPITLSNGDKTLYGLGLMISKYQGLNIVEHDGRDAGYRSHLIRFPDQSFAVACLCNLALRDSNLPGKLVRRVADVYLADQFVPGTPTPDPGPAPLLPSGIYWDSRTESFAKLSIIEFNTLNLLCFPTHIPETDDDCRVLIPLGGNRYLWGDGPFEIESSQSNGGSRLTVTANGQPTRIFDAVPPAASPHLAEYEGRFYSREIDSEYGVSLRGSRLEITRHKYPPAVLYPIFRDAFAMSDFNLLMPFSVVRFERDAQGHVVGFLFSGDRTRSLQFTKSN
jgi:CubicO group peptidase (beta-lactamase class C family)